MDDKLEKALDFSNFRQTLYNQQQTLKVKVINELLLTYQESIFKATPELIGLVKTIVDFNYPTVIIDDINENPVNIKNPSEFLENLIATYSKAKNSHYNGYAKIKKARSVKKLGNFEYRCNISCI